MKIIILTFILIFINFIKSLKYSPLQVQNIAISLIRNNAGQYQINLDIYQFPIYVNSLIFCFQLLTVQIGQKNYCNLAQKQNYFKCLQTKFIYTNQTYQLNSTYKQFNLSTYGKNTSLNTGNVQLITSQRKIILKNNYLQDFQIYKMVTATYMDDLIKQINYQSMQYTNLKYNIVHTYAHNNYKDTLISQRYSTCMIYQNKIIHLFEGAVYRQNVDYFFTSILTIDQTEQFHMWGGYSYSTSHAARDMVGYQSYNSKFYDLFSLIAAAPFQDISSNINGQKNIVRISNSLNSSAIKINSTYTPYHFIQFYRKFDTNDTKGDQILREKIYNRFCFAGYFQYIENQNQTLTFSLLNNSFIHQFIECHQPVLIVGQNNFKISIFGLFSIILLIFNL